MPELHVDCQQSGCYMFEAGTEWHDRCVQDCRLLRGEPKVTAAGLAPCVAAGMELGQQLQKENVLDTQRPKD